MTPEQKKNRKSRFAWEARTKLGGHMLLFNYSFGRVAGDQARDSFSSVRSIRKTDMGVKEAFPAPFSHDRKSLPFLQCVLVSDLDKSSLGGFSGFSTTQILQGDERTGARP